MMLPQDSLLLAFTKLRTRRIRLIVTIFVSALLFIILTTVSLVMNGVIDSVEDFSEEGLGKRYITRLDTTDDGQYMLLSDPGVIAEAKTAFADYKNRRVAEAKRLKFEYDPKQEVSPVIVDGGPNGGEYLDGSSPLVQEILAKRAAADAVTYYQKIDEVAAANNAIGKYSSVPIASSFSSFGTPGYTITTIQDGKEKDPVDQQSFNTVPRGFDTIVGEGITAMSDEILSTFTLPGVTLEDQKDGAIPIIAPYTAVEQVLKLPTLPNNASSSEKLDRVKEIRAAAAGVTFQVCLRNTLSTQRQQEAIQQQSEITQNKGKKDYVMPTRVFDRAETPCSDVVTTRDVRTTSEKTQEKKQNEFDSLFGKVTEPKQRLVTFRIAGISPDPPSFESFKITDLIGGLLASNIGNGWLIPLSSSPLLPEFAGDFDNIGVVTDYTIGNYIEFSDAATARKVINESSCVLDITFMGGNMSEVCEAQGKPFFINSFGSSSIALEEVRSTFQSVFINVLFVISIISALIMMGTVGKVIADSRRETAVFRAIGAKRLDIAQIYVTYSMLLGLSIIGFSLGAGWLLASFIDGRYGTEFTVSSLVAFNASDLSREFSLLSFNANQLGRIAVIILIGSVISAALPLISNLRRNPIKDMRDER